MCIVFLARVQHPIPFLHAMHTYPLNQVIGKYQYILSMQQDSTRILTNEQLVYEYFKRISESPGDALEMFTDDAIVCEPFSGDKTLHGREEIAYFLKVARMANQGFQKEIRITASKKDSVEAVVQFTRGESIMGRFLFKTEDLESRKSAREKKIKELRIQFLTQ